MVKFEEKTAYHAETEEEAWWLLQEAHKQGYKWATKNSFLESRPGFHLSSYPCYDITKGMRSDLEFYKKRDYNIINVKDLITEKIIELW